MSFRGVILFFPPVVVFVVLFVFSIFCCHCRLSQHRGPINTVALHPTFNVCVSGSEDCSVRVWNLDSGVCEQVLTDHVASVEAVCFSPDGALLGGCLYWCTCLPFSLLLETMREGEGFLTFLGTFAATCSKDLYIKIWNTEGNQWRCTKTLQGHRHRFSQSSLSLPLFALPSHHYSCSLGCWLWALVMVCAVVCFLMFSLVVS